MIYTISNGILTAKFSSLGAELKSLVFNDIEYIWQGDKKYWTGSAPLMFPNCGRMWEGAYTYKGNTYQIALHGFLRKSELELYEHLSDTITFILKSSPETKAVYPFDFSIKITYSLNGKSLITSANVYCESDQMYFAFGGHPAFNVPLLEGENFTDYSVEFSAPCPAKRMEFSERFLKTGNFPLYNGENLTTIPLSHDLFDFDAIFLKDTSNSATLSNKKGLGVRIDYPDMKYLGIWHTPKTDAPFVCLEPWCGSPALDGGVSDLATSEDYFKLEKDESKTLSFTITIL